MEFLVVSIKIFLPPLRTDFRFFHDAESVRPIAFYEYHALTLSLNRADHHISGGPRVVGQFLGDPFSCNPEDAGELMVGGHGRCRVGSCSTGALHEWMGLVLCSPAKCTLSEIPP